MNPRVKQVKYQNSYKLIITFTDDQVKEFDFSGYLNYPVFEPLKDEAFCKKVKVFNGTVAWNNEIDFDADTLYLESKKMSIA